MTCQHVRIITCAIKERRVWNRYFDSDLTSEAISGLFYVPLCLFNVMLRLLVWKPDFGGNLLNKLSKVDILAIF